MRTPLISVVVPTLNEEKYLEDCLKSLKNQTFKDYEIIVSDGNSDDNTVKIAKKYADNVIITEREGLPAGRNAGARAAKGDIFVFMDADTIASKNVLADIADTIKNKKVVGGVCAFYPYKGTRIDQFLYRIVNLISFLSINLGIYIYNPGICLFSRKKTFIREGGYRPDLVYCEDTDFVVRLKKHGKFVRLSTPVFTSLRRVQKKGILRSSLSYILPTIYYVFTKKVPSRRFELETIR